MLLLLGWQRPLSYQRQTLPALFAPGPTALWLWVEVWICRSLQRGNDVLGYLGWRQLPTPTGQEKLGVCYKTSPHHILTQSLSPMQQDGSCHSFKQESGKNLRVVMIWTQLTSSKQEILFLKGKICLHRMLLRVGAKARRVTQVFLNHQTDKQGRTADSLTELSKLLKAWKLWNSQYHELRPRGQTTLCRPPITEKGLPAVLS